MKRFFKYIFIWSLCVVLRLALKLRYKVTYKGFDTIKKQLKNEKRGILFLPNHPSIVVDPLLVTLPLLPTFSVRPLITEHMYFTPLIHWASRLINALPMPNFQTSFNPIKQRRAERMLDTMSAGLQAGERFLLYPSGTTKIGPKEILGGAFGAHHLISKSPDSQIVFVRLTGLWGSMTSRALTHGEAPSLRKVIKKGFWILCKNLFLFTPRREVVIEFEIAPSDFPRKGSKMEINRYLENWYNKPFVSRDGKDNFGEPLKLISYAFWRSDLPSIEKAAEERIDLTLIPDVVREQVIAKISKLARLPPEKIKTSQHLIADLGLDSLDLAELLAFLEEYYDVTAIQPGDLTTVSRALLIAMQLYQRPEVPEPEWNLRRWNKERPLERMHISDGETIPEVFLRTCDEKLFDVAAADFRSGITSYRALKTKILLLSEYIRKLPGHRIGILLPASLAVEVIVLACQFAGKTPVMINWTVGGRHLDTVVETSKIENVLTSWSFLDNLENVDISRIENMLVILEEFKVRISLWSMLKASFMSLLSSRQLLRLQRFQHFHNKQFRKEAVILYTSGTEAMPKGVPLSHKNILSNLRAVLKTVELNPNDKLLAMLPPFHSFGFTVTGFLPLLAGIRVVFYPNPTDSKRLARAIKKWRATVIASAPTFLKNILYASERNMLSSLRLIFSGAEKAPQELFDLCLKLCAHAKVTEGYGITECAPVLTVNAEGIREFGVGRPIPGVELKIVHPETHEPISANTVGLVLAAGPNVFAGYLNPGLADPFLEIGGSRWYNTGDLGMLDREGHLLLAGRLKRFVKIGGEMISLTAIENTLTAKVTELKKVVADVPQCVVCAEETDGGRPKLTLFTSYPFTVGEVNHILREHGFSNLVKIDAICQIDEIPVTATGKVAYRILEKQLQTATSVL